MSTLSTSFPFARFPLSSRSHRIAAALFLLIAFGLGDLALTLHAMLTTGMYEDNPLVVTLIKSTGSPLALIAFKLLTMGAGAALLFRLRRFRSAEFGAFIGAAAMAGVLVMWAMYLHSFAGIDPASLKVDPHWIRL